MIVGVWEQAALGDPILFPPEGWPLSSVKCYAARGPTGMPDSWDPIAGKIKPDGGHIVEVSRLITVRLTLDGRVLCEWNQPTTHNGSFKLRPEEYLWAPTGTVLRLQQIYGPPIQTVWRAGFGDGEIDNDEIREGLELI